MSYLVVAFRSRAETLGFYRYLLSNGFSCEIVNTPKEASVGCGLSVKVSSGYESYLKQAVKNFKGKSFAGIFAVKKVGNKKLAIRV